jgi:hypothetical protein
MAGFEKQVFGLEPLRWDFDGICMNDTNSHDGDGFVMLILSMMEWIWQKT